MFVPYVCGEGEKRSDKDTDLTSSLVSYGKEKDDQASTRGTTVVRTMGVWLSKWQFDGCVLQRRCKGLWLRSS